MIQIGAGKTLKRLDDMLTEAMNGTFEESSYDETELSRLESRWKEYLTTSKMSRQQTEKEREKMKALVSDISHQTKTPLANILLYTELLGEQTENEQEKKLAEQILKQTEKLEFLIQALVKMSRLESNVLEVLPKRQAVMPLVEQAVGAVMPEARKKQIRIFLNATSGRQQGAMNTAEPETMDITEPVSGEAETMDITEPVSGEPETIEAVYDAKWTAEALGNVLDNAVKYAPEGSTIYVDVKAYEFYVCISVRDEGMGIRESEKARIFQRFYRSPSVQQKDGIGIGLYLAREILQREKGYIKVSSEEGKGSTFSLYLSKKQEIEQFC